MFAPRFPKAFRSALSNSTGRGAAPSLKAAPFDVPGYTRAGSIMRAGDAPTAPAALSIAAAHRFPGPRGLAHLPPALRVAACAWLAAQDRATAPNDNPDAAARARLAVGDAALDVAPFRIVGMANRGESRAPVGAIPLSDVLRLAGIAAPADFARKVLTVAGVIDAAAHVDPRGRLVIEVNRALHIAAARLARAYGLPVSPDAPDLDPEQGPVPTARKGATPTAPRI